MEGSSVWDLFKTTRYIRIIVDKTSYHGVNAFPVKDGKEFLGSAAGVFFTDFPFLDRGKDGVQHG